MPAVHPPATVLVTGVSGFSGSWITRVLLENGYVVRGTVRSENKAAFVADLFKAHEESFKTVIVSDISKLSPLVRMAKAGVAELSGRTASEIMGPNTDGVMNLLNSMLKHGKNVKRFLYMSSAQAMLGHEDIFHVYTEDDWAEKALADVKEKGNAADGSSLYRASKVLAERAIIDFVEQHKGEIGWDATRVVPCWICGPLIHDWHTLDDLNLSSKLLYEQLTTPRDDDKVNDYASEYIDVRDVAEAFVAALKVEAAGNERFILDAGAYTYQNLYDAVHATAPDLQGVVRGNTKAPSFSFPGAFCDASKAKRVLQLKEFRSLGECAVDAFKSIQAKLQAV